MTAIGSTRKTAHGKDRENQKRWLWGIIHPSIEKQDLNEPEEQKSGNCCIKESWVCPGIVSKEKVGICIV